MFVSSSGSTFDIEKRKEGAYTITALHEKLTKEGLRWDCDDHSEKKIKKTLKNKTKMIKDFASISQFFI